VIEHELRLAPQVTAPPQWDRARNIQPILHFRSASRYSKYRTSRSPGRSRHRSRSAPPDSSDSEEIAEDRRLPAIGRRVLFPDQRSAATA
jgi:hypothetical protein